MKKIITLVLLPYIALESLWTLVFGRGFGVYQFNSIVLDIYNKMGFESYVKYIANLEEDTGRCTRFYGIARKSYLDRYPVKRLQGRYGNRF
jgi:hypothetical protein